MLLRNDRVSVGEVVDVQKWKRLERFNKGFMKMDGRGERKWRNESEDGKKEKRMEKK